MAEEELEELNLTYETLFEYLRREKERDDIQELPEKFYEEAANYIDERLRNLNHRKQSKGQYYDAEIQKDEKQLYNVRKLITDIFERREKKIASLSLLIAKLGPEMIDSSNLLPEERVISEHLIKIFSGSRQNIISAVLSAKKPLLSDLYSIGSSIASDNSQTQKTEISDKKFIRFLQSVPKFVGEELEVYGPFEKEDVAHLPSSIASVLIDKERAEEITVDEDDD